MAAAAAAVPATGSSNGHGHGGPGSGGGGAIEISVMPRGTSAGAASSLACATVHAPNSPRGLTPAPGSPTAVTRQRLDGDVMRAILLMLRHDDLLEVACVCRSWKRLVYHSKSWASVFDVSFATHAAICVREFAARHPDWRVPDAAAWQTYRWHTITPPPAPPAAATPAPTAAAVSPAGGPPPSAMDVKHAGGGSSGNGHDGGVLTSPAHVSLNVAADNKSPASSSNSTGGGVVPPPPGLSFARAFGLKVRIGASSFAMQRPSIEVVRLKGRAARRRAGFPVEDDGADNVHLTPAEHRARQERLQQQYPHRVPDLLDHDMDNHVTMNQAFAQVFRPTPDVAPVATDAQPESRHENQSVAARAQWVSVDAVADAVAAALPQLTRTPPIPTPTRLVFAYCRYYSALHDFQKQHALPRYPPALTTVPLQRVPHALAPHPWWGGTPGQSPSAAADERFWFDALRFDTPAHNWRLFDENVRAFVPILPRLVTHADPLKRMLPQATATPATTQPGLAPTISSAAEPDASALDGASEPWHDERDVLDGSTLVSLNGHHARLYFGAPAHAASTGYGLHAPLHTTWTVFGLRTGAMQLPNAVYMHRVRQAGLVQARADALVQFMRERGGFRSAAAAADVKTPGDGTAAGAVGLSPTLQLVNDDDDRPTIDVSGAIMSTAASRSPVRASAGAATVAAALAPLTATVGSSTTTTASPARSPAALLVAARRLTSQLVSTAQTHAPAWTQAVRRERFAQWDGGLALDVDDPYNAFHTGYNARCWRAGPWRVRTSAAVQVVATDAQQQRPTAQGPVAAAASVAAIAAMAVAVDSNNRNNTKHTKHGVPLAALSTAVKQQPGLPGRQRVDSVTSFATACAATNYGLIGTDLHPHLRALFVQTRRDMYATFVAGHKHQLVAGNDVPQAVCADRDDRITYTYWRYWTGYMCVWMLWALSVTVPARLDLGDSYGLPHTDSDWLLWSWILPLLPAWIISVLIFVLSVRAWCPRRAGAWRRIWTYFPHDQSSRWSYASIGCQRGFVYVLYLLCMTGVGVAFSWMLFAVPFIVHARLLRSPTYFDAGPQYDGVLPEPVLGQIGVYETFLPFLAAVSGLSIFWCVVCVAMLFSAYLACREDARRQRARQQQQRAQGFVPGQGAPPPGAAAAPAAPSATGPALSADLAAMWPADDRYAEPPLSSLPEYPLLQTWHRVVLRSLSESAFGRLDMRGEYALAMMCLLGALAIHMSLLYQQLLHTEAPESPHYQAGAPNLLSAFVAPMTFAAVIFGMSVPVVVRQIPCYCYGNGAEAWCDCACSREPQECADCCYTRAEGCLAGCDCHGPANWWSPFCTRLIFISTLTPFAVWLLLLGLKAQYSIDDPTLLASGMDRVSWFVVFAPLWLMFAVIQFRYTMHLRQRLSDCDCCCGCWRLGDFNQIPLPEAGEPLGL